MLLAAQGVYPHAAIAGTVLLDVFLVSTVLLGGWFTGQWIYRPLELDRMHPGYFLPTVAGGLVASAGATEVGQRRLAEVVFGLGLICWIVLGSILLARLLVRPALPAALTPTLAIEVAPAAVASLAYFGLNGDRVDFAAAVLAGYGMLMVLAQLRLIPAYRRLSFMPGLWAFTFPWAAVATSAIHWLHDTAPTGSRGYEYVILAAITTGIGSLAIRTLAALAQGKLLAAPSATPTGSPAEPSGPKPPSLASADRRGTG
jgi:tellurite resistance protein